VSNGEDSVDVFTEEVSEGLVGLFLDMNHPFGPLGCFGTFGGIVVLPFIIPS